MITQFAEWSANLAESSSLGALRGSTVGIEAAEYLNRLHEFKIPKLSDPAGVLPEPLLPALGGVPFGLARVVRVHLAAWQKFNIKPIFVFSGLDVSKSDAGFESSTLAARKLAAAWTCYDANDANAAVENFRTSNAIKATDLFRFLQTILRTAGIQYIVAPYCAWAQLSYFAKNRVTDLTYGASETFLFDIQEVITSWDFLDESVVWVRRRNCINSLGNLTPDAFVDACMLAGNDLLPSLPQLDSGNVRKQPKLKTAADMVMNIGRGSGNGVCVHYQDDSRNQGLDYTELFRKARLSVKHHVVIGRDGKLMPLDVDNAPGDIHEFIGQRLPDELYFYLSKGIIGPRVLNWRTSGEALEGAPLDGGESIEYQGLVRDQLLQMRTSTVGLLVMSLHHYYQNTGVKLRCWFAKEDVRTIDSKVHTEMKPIIDSWNVPQSIFGTEFNKHEGSSLFGICVKSLKNKDFAASSITKKNKTQLLETKDELLANAIWRMLHIRGYVDDKHNLTPWGEVLHAMVSELPLEHQERALIAVELAQFGRLNASSSVRYTGVPEGFPDAINKHMTLISRIACLGHLNHQEIGYTGVLSRNMLAYLSTLDAVRSGLRDLSEVCLTTILLNGDANRERQDFSELGLDLPFLTPLDCCLGVAVAFHLTECNKWPDARSQDNKDALLADERQKFCYAIDLPSSFQSAWTLWDAVYKGVKSAPTTFTEKAAFETANAWLAQYR